MLHELMYLLYFFNQLSKIIDCKACNINEYVSFVQSPGSGSTSPQGAESSSHHLPSHEGSDSIESPSPASKEYYLFPSRFSATEMNPDIPGPCDPEDLIDGIIFAANYLGSTQLLSDKTPSKNVRMMQAQEAVSRIKTAQKLAKNRKKAPEGEAQPMTEVDLFISTQRIKVLNADSQDTMMDHPLRTISYIADIGNIVVLMARRKMPRSDSQENMEASDPAQDEKRQYKMICHVFESEDAQLIAQSIGQAFSVAYQEFLRANGINPEDLSQKEYSDLLNTQDMYNDDLIHFSKSENCIDVYIEKQKGEILGVVIVESGWGSILPTVIIANMMHGGPAEKSGRLNIGDQIMSINGTSLVGLPLSTCQSIIKGLKNQSRIKLNIVRCPPVTTVLIRRPDLRYQLGFSVQNGIICSLMRGGIAERGGVRVGHRIIEINSQSVVATPHEKIVHILSNAVGEIHMKTMPAAMYRLLTAQEQPVYI
uniref:Amyloid beta (A4) precursor protein-binding, family A, member 1a n=1 Tax=Cyprinus carpio TaxID=7962 RepID=A0A8C1WGR2_CYPCA